MVRAVDGGLQLCYRADPEGKDSERHRDEPHSGINDRQSPYSKQLDAQALAHCLLDPSVAKAAPGHMSAFFGDVSPASQIAFAGLYNISEQQLIDAAKAFAIYSGESYPLAA